MKTLAIAVVAGLLGVAAPARCPELTPEERASLTEHLAVVDSTIAATVVSSCETLLEVQYYDEDRADCEMILRALAGMGEQKGRVKAWLDN